jgi:hypothetical protein
MLEHRRVPRKRVREWAKILFENGRPHQKCVILDISEGGAGLLVDSIADLPDSFLLLRKSDQSLREAQVVRRGKRDVGVLLTPPLDPTSERVKALGHLSL